MSNLRGSLKENYIKSLRRHRIITNLYKNDCKGNLLRVLDLKISMMEIHSKMVSGYSDYPTKAFLSEFLSGGIKDLKEIKSLIKSFPQDIEEKNDWIEETLKKIDPENKIMHFYKEFYQIILDSKETIIN